MNGNPRYGVTSAASGGFNPIIAAPPTSNPDK